MSGLDEYYLPTRCKGSNETNTASPSGLSNSRQDRDEPVNLWEPEVYDSDLESDIEDVGEAAHARKMRKWKSLARTKYEKMFLDCIVNTEAIPPNYENIHVEPAVIKQLERVTRMSLLMPKAFNHGILASNKITGAILWGPPGTGKTLLAKAVARQSGFNMILASASELWQEMHGEDEKVIKALFSLARKMHPAIIFIDEADAMLGSRRGGETRHIRSMLNQFLMEWDGLTSGKNSPFILLATNRPFDLDPAVLRRSPMQIHLDIPTLSQRQGILKVILRHEELAPDVSLDKLAAAAPRYTGSDLKNMCVAAATECVGEMSEDMSQRVLRLRHFKAAMNAVGATKLSEKMEHQLHSFSGGGDGLSRGGNDMQSADMDCWSHVTNATLPEHVIGVLSGLR